MKSFFLAIVLLFLVPTAYAQSPSLEGVSEHETIDSQLAFPKALAMVQDQTSPDQNADDGGEVPYTGFNVIAGIMIVVTISILVFVVLRVFRGTERKRKEEEQ